jgi:hypothetical protein
MNRKLKIIVPILIMLLLINNTIVMGKRVKTEGSTTGNNDKNRRDEEDKVNKGKGKNKVTSTNDESSTDDTSSDSTTPDPSEPSPLPPPPEPKVEVDIFKDPDCTILLENFVWGEIDIGGTSTQTVYIKNNGDINLVLTLSSDNYYPTNLVDYINLYWDYDGSPIAPGEVFKVQITLLIKSDCPLMDTFSFDVIITGS